MREVEQKRLNMLTAKAREDADEGYRRELQAQKQVLKTEHDREEVRLRAQFARERVASHRKLKELERQLEKRTANELGDGAEIDLAEAHAHLERALTLWPAVPDAAGLTGLDLAGLCAWTAELASRTGAAPRAARGVGAAARRAGVAGRDRRAGRGVP